MYDDLLVSKGLFCLVFVTIAFSVALLKVLSECLKWKALEVGWDSSKNLKIISSRHFHRRGNDRLGQTPHGNLNLPGPTRTTIGVKRSIILNSRVRRATPIPSIPSFSFFFPELNPDTRDVLLGKWCDSFYIFWVIFVPYSVLWNPDLE